jgi:glycosyltransferase involved in cell wall biosynthesis
LNTKRNPEIMFLSTYPPRACGIATFTQDLVGALSKTGKIKTGIVAVNDNDYDYPPEVQMTLKQYSPESYPETAEKINSSSSDLLMIEHEFGIYGGECGEYILKFAEALKKPYCVTLHTVLPKPLKKQETIIRQLAAGCQKLVTMSSSSVHLLENIYGVPKEKISVIPHGVPELPMEDRESLKKQENLEGRFVVSTFGLLSPGKGLEYGIEAIARIAKQHPEIVYLILGQTHPGIKKRNGEKYRESLEKLVQKYGISKHVLFVNKYLTKQEIIRYLCMSDVYMTPYLGKDQAVSGTLAYAAGYGCAIVSTPYPYAEEMLADGRGLLAEFKNADSLAKCIMEIMRDHGKQNMMENKMLSFGRNMMWSRVAEKYLSVFSQSI